ncbi:MAG: hypothetical protein UW68_C0015G0027 [Candidatus Collierbacteria bacterium GW2011_GWB1_44_6]|uniref:ATP-grasp domain-containing protein n=1 Tax=Candidatus Collierbacteria bacterium GW2011_GWB1_44_6 TaxID=1618384 RepID=A0A0G1MMI1_9BACT|nr:MAG: hypothetical protein UW68_C0015G0027 [Candidatus Collierbacteria bacterium GW2011_GWB1_44_6]
MNKPKKLTQSDKPGGSKKERVVRIFNLSEDVWPFIEAYGDKKLQKWEIDENANLSDKDLFSMAEEFEFTFITAKPLDPLFVEYYKKLCEVRDLEILVPEKHTGQLCEDIKNDGKIMKRLLRLGREYSRINITAYSTTPNFLDLIEILRSKGVDVRTPEAPDRSDAWTVNFYGSKSGIRQLTQINGAIRADLKMPDGVISSGIVDTAGIAANKYIKENGVVIKTNKGHSGAGVLIFRKGDLPKKFAECEEKIIKILNKDAYWEKFPIVVESLVNPNPKIGGGFPNAEFFIRRDGEVEFLYACGMRVNEKGEFGGVEIGEGVLPKRVASRITDIGYLIGEQYSKDGYRGYYDVDYIAEKGGVIWVSESNVRVTGGTHVYEAGKELAGRNFTKKSFVLSNNMFGITPKKFTFSKLHKIMTPILFSRKTREGLVICSSNLLHDGYMSYIIFGKNKKRVIAIEEEMKEKLKL